MESLAAAFRKIQYGATVDRVTGRLHDDVRIVACLVNQYSDTPLAYSSYTMALTLAFRRMVWGWDSDVICS